MKVGEGNGGHHRKNLLTKAKFTAIFACQVLGFLKGSCFLLNDFLFCCLWITYIPKF